MNILSLRINSLKLDGNSSQNSQDLFQLSIEDFWSEDQKSQLESINKSENLEDQLRKFRIFIQQIRNEKSLQLDIIMKCWKFYFNEKVKHPAKSLIQSCFNQVNDFDNEVIESLKQHIIDICVKSIIENNEKSYHLISCFNEASQNFKVAKNIMKLTKDNIIEVSRVYLEFLNKTLANESSPARKNDISTQIHGTLQLLIFCRKNLIESDDFINPTELFLNNMKLVDEICSNLMNNPEIPLDTKNNCGLCLCENGQNNQKDEFDSINPTENIHRFLALSFGIVNSSKLFNSEDLSSMASRLEIYETKEALDPTVMLAIARLYSQLSKKSLMFEKQHKSESNDIIKFTLQFAINNLEHHIDSVRYLSKEVLTNIVDFAVESSQEKLQKIYHEHCLNHMKFENYTSAIMWIQVFPKINPTPQISKNLIDPLLELFETTENLNPVYIQLYLMFSRTYKLILGYENWFEYFVESLYNKLAMNNFITNRTIMENLIYQIIEKDKNAVKKFFTLKHPNNEHIFYKIISRANKSGIFDDKISTITEWRGILPYEELKNAMIVNNDDMRIAAFSLIVETRKTTMNFTKVDVECILHFLKYNINIQSPSTRQSILGMLKNMFARIQSTLTVVIRKKMQDFIDFYFNFLKDLQVFCLENLFEGANFSRRVLSLRILFHVLEAFNEHFPNNSEEIWDQMKFNVVMQVFHDSYEANKEMMIEIMRLVPRNVITKFNMLTLDDIKCFVTSIKPPENLAAAYLIEFYSLFIQNDFTHSFMLNWCVELLKNGLEIAEKSLFAASCLNPLYGQIYAMRHLISKLNLKELANNVEWHQFFNDLIPLSKRLTDVVGIVVNDAAPEGILPVEDYDEEMQIYIEKATPQMILLCSWRTIKDTSLMLGDISSRAPVKLLSTTQIIKISNHFLELLSNTKHRGAFEQCFFGFSQLCFRLWTSTEPELFNLPTQILNTMIDMVSGKDEDDLDTIKSLCSTRRSAGLPFVIQALITSELKVGMNKNFHYVMRNLIDFARNGELLETRTHSLNILRALFRCSDLGEPICEYIEDGIKIAIQGYEATSWTLRNSSTLLFSALMVRIFGVQKTRDDDEMNIRNKMTGRIFFLRYPALFDFFMNELKKASKFVERSQTNSKLHPLMLILNRLYPSSLEGSESNLKVEEFIPLVTLCSSCVELQTRVLCAKFIANVLRCELIQPRIFETVKILREYDELPANISHGILLQILYLLKKIPKSNDGNFKELQKLLEELSTINNRFKSQLICFATILDIYLELFIEFDIEANDSIIQQCLDIKTIDVFGIPLISHKLFLLKESQKLKTSSKQIYDAISNPFLRKQAKRQVLHSQLNVKLVAYKYEYAIKMADDYCISTQELKLGMKKNADSKQNEKLDSTELFDDKCDDYFMQIKYNDIYAESYENLDIVSLDLTQPEHELSSNLKRLNSTFLNGSSSLIFEQKFDFLPEISTHSSSHVKSVALDILSNLLKIFENSHMIQTSTRTLVLNITKSILLLLMDDEETTRNECVKILTRNENFKYSTYVPCYVQEKFLENLQVFYPFLQNSEYIAIILEILIHNVDGKNSLEETIVDYKVFDKSEVNIFSESFVVMKKCRDILKTKFEFDDVIKTMNEITKNESTSYETIKNSLIDVMK